MKRGHPAQNEDPWAVDASRDRRRLDILSLVPLVAIVALVALIGSLIWAVNRADAERLRTKLATDALWVEQTLRFQMAVDEDMLARLAQDQVSGVPDSVLEGRARVHVAANPEMLSVVWYDNQGRMTHAVPGRAAPSDPELVATILRGQVVSTRPIYGEPADGVVTFGLRPAEGGGIVTATISLPMILNRHVPWWIAEQYGVYLIRAEQVLAERVRRRIDEESPAHSISFEPPLRGTVLQIAAYDRPPAFARTLMLAAVAALAIVAIFALLALYRSILRRRQTELRLRGEMAFRRSMEDSLTVGIRAKDHDGRILYANAAFCNLVGLPADVLIGHVPPMPYWAPDQLEETLTRQNALREGGAASPQAFETRFLRSDGAPIDVQVYEAPLIDAQGRHRGWMGSIIDITEAKKAARMAREHDESLTRTSRLVTLGEMASTLAHELNQPLGAIASYAAGGLNLLQAGNPDPALMTQAMDRIALQSRRAGLIIRRIQDLVKKREPQFSDMSLNEVITETVGFMAAGARENRVRIATELAPVPPVRCDRILIEQLLINLIRNGIEAMTDADRTGGALTVSLSGDATGQKVMIDIADQGAGIAADLQGHLFEAFTSTKAQGMGMGLNICRSIAELHRGHLSHRPREGGGTVFTVTLPTAQSLADGKSGADAA